METIRQLITRFSKWEHAGLLVLVLVTLGLHFSIIMAPDEPLFDEQHYIPDARLIIDGEGTGRPEHPPLAKLFMVGGIQLFGDNPFGWRFFSVILGTMCIIFFYLICRRLALPERVSFLAAFLLAFENLSFVQAGIAMLDVYSLVFAMAAFWLYLRGNYAISGVAIALSALAKLNGILVLPVIGLHWFLADPVRPRRFLLSTMLTTPAAFLMLMPLFDYAIQHKWLNPVAQIERMLMLSSSITNAQYPDVGSRPWEWIFTYPRVMEVMPYWWAPPYTGIISPTIWALIIPVTIYIIYRTIKGNIPMLLPFSWFLGTYLIWIPLSLITDRVTYVFYFYHAVGAICIGLAMALFRLLDIAEARETGKLRWLIKLGVPFYLLLHLIVFIVITPLPPLSIVWQESPYVITTPESIWWSIPLYLLLYTFTLRFLSLDKGLRPGQLNGSTIGQ
jgi:dolichyl-phosphate-mannose--protein O-mannosyl transferase